MAPRGHTGCDIIDGSDGMYQQIVHCGLENNITFLSPTHKMDGGHEIRAKSVWEIRIPRKGPSGPC